MEERDAYAKECIQSYLDDWWNESVSRIVAGVLTHRVKQTDREERPDTLDEDGCDEDGYAWGDYDYSCNYELLPILAKNAPETPQ